MEMFSVLCKLAIVAKSNTECMHFLHENQQKALLKKKIGLHIKPQTSEIFYESKKYKDTGLFRVQIYSVPHSLPLDPEYVHHQSSKSIEFKVLPVYHGSELLPGWTFILAICRREGAVADFECIARKFKTPRAYSTPRHDV